MCLDNPIPPPPLVDDVVIVDPYNLTLDPDVWPAGLYGTDASGGKWGAYAPLRRCGCAAVRLTSMDAPFSLEWAAYFPLIGKVQTVPRAELYSIFMVVSKVPQALL